MKLSGFLNLGGIGGEIAALVVVSMACSRMAAAEPVSGGLSGRQAAMASRLGCDAS
jgi:hypothetical protein